MQTSIFFDHIEIIERGERYKFLQCMRHINQLGLDGYELVELKPEEVGRGVQYTFTSRPLTFKAKIREFFNQFSKSKRKYT